MSVFDSTVLLSKCPSRIESIACWVTASSCLVFVGTAEGTLLVYELLDQPDATFRLLIPKKNFARDKKPIRQLQVVSRWGVLLSVYEGRVQSHSLHSEPLLNEQLLGLERYDGVVSFAANSQEHTLCLLTAKGMDVFRWNDDTNQHQWQTGRFAYTRHIAMAQPPTNAVWLYHGAAICVSFANNTTLYNTRSGEEIYTEVRTRKSSKKSQPALVIRHSINDASDRSELLLCRETTGCFVSSTGSPTRELDRDEDDPVGEHRTSISWRAAPTAMASCQPYVVALIPGAILVHASWSCRQVQTMSLQNPVGLCTTVDSEVNALLSPINKQHQDFLQNLQARVFVATDKSILCLKMQSLEGQVARTLSEKHSKNPLRCADALAICYGLDSAPWLAPGCGLRVGIGAQCTKSHLTQQIGRVHREYGLDLFRGSQFADSLTHFSNACLANCMAPDQLLCLFVRSDLFDSVAEGTTQVENFKLACGLFMEYLEDLVTPGDAPHVDDHDALHAMRASISVAPDAPACDPETLKDSRLYPDAVKHLLVPILTDFRALVIECIHQANGSKDESAATLLLTAIDSLLLRGYIVGDVVNLSKPTSKTQGVLNFRLPRHLFLPRLRKSRLVATGGDSVFEKLKVEFFQGDNWCAVKECEKLLLRYPEAWIDLLWLYYSKGMHEKSLSWLHDLALNEKENRKAVHTSELRGKMAPSVYAVKSIEYLRKLGRPHSALVFKYSRWVLEEYREQGLQIFLKKDPLQSLEPAKVLQHLEVYDRSTLSSAVARSKPVPIPLAIVFLEYLVYDQASTSETFHNKLAHLYLETIMVLRASQDGVKTDDHTEKLLLQRSSSCESGSLENGTAAAADVEPNHEDRVLETRASLLKFLQFSRYISAEGLSMKFKATDLHNEYAVLLEKSGQYDAAVRVYVTEMRSFKAAETFCNDVYDPSRRETQGVYMSLIRACLEDSSDGADGENAMAHVQELLVRYYDKVDVTTMLRVLPPSIAVGQLHQYLELVLQLHATKRCNNQVVKQLLQKEHLQVMREKAARESKYVVLTRERVCTNPNCNRRFQNGGAFVRYPNGNIVHYACWVDQQ